MLIGGLQKFSLSDFPGVISAIVFTRGCNFRCPYCHNPALVDPSQYAVAIPAEEVMRFLASRKGQLQGVVVTGGEPTLHLDLPDFMAALKSMGYQVKLDTNGSRPEILDRIIGQGLVDYIAMDIKAGAGSYARVAHVDVDVKQIQQSIDMIACSGIPYEFRTTYLEALLSIEDMAGVAELARGCRRFWLQKCSTASVLDPSIAGQPGERHSAIEAARALLEASGIDVRIR